MGVWCSDLRSCNISCCSIDCCNLGHEEKIVKVTLFNKQMASKVLNKVKMAYNHETKTTKRTPKENECIAIIPSNDYRKTNDFDDYTVNKLMVSFPENFVAKDQSTILLCKRVVDNMFQVEQQITVPRNIGFSGISYDGDLIIRCPLQMEIINTVTVKYLLGCCY